MYSGERSEAHRGVLLSFGKHSEQSVKVFLIDWIYGDMYNIDVCLCHLTAYMLYKQGCSDPK